MVPRMLMGATALLASALRRPGDGSLLTRGGSLPFPALLVGLASHNVPFVTASAAGFLG